MIHEFANSALLAEALADYTVNAINQRLRQSGTAAIAVSGGTTPIRFFKALANKPADWRNVIITLVDDRWVPVSSPRSNAALVHANLLQGQAAAATFQSLVNDAETPEQGRAAVEQALQALPLPFAAVILGMGADGHTASFFPGGNRLATALNPAGRDLVQPMHAAAAIEPRITLTLPPLLAAQHLAIHIEGAAKRRVLEQALQPGEVAEMPIRAILQHEPPPDVFWCP